MAYGNGMFVAGGRCSYPTELNIVQGAGKLVVVAYSDNNPIIMYSNE
jgi:hypothetical protein